MVSCKVLNVKTVVGFAFPGFVMPEIVKVTVEPPARLEVKRELRVILRFVVSAVHTGVAPFILEDFAVMEQVEDKVKTLGNVMVIPPVVAIVFDVVILKE